MVSAYQLDAAEGSVVAAHFSRDVLKSVEEIGAHHAHLQKQRFTNNPFHIQRYDSELL
jgi:hypothetical protein